MKTRSMRRLAVAIALCAVIGGAVVWLKWPRYKLTDIFEHQYRLTGTELAIEPITIDLTGYTTGDEEEDKWAWNNADILVYQGPHCAIKIDTIRRRYGVYEVYFTIYNNLKDGVYLTAPVKWYCDPTGELLCGEMGSVEVLVGGEWYPCDWIAYTDVNEEASFAVKIDSAGDREEIRIKQADTGQVTLRFRGIWENHWEW